jgi:hypothetical protein
MAFQAGMPVKLLLFKYICPTVAEFQSGESVPAHVSGKFPRVPVGSNFQTFRTRS